MGQGTVGRLLWVSDACVQTGFGRVTHEVAGRLSSTWDVQVLGLGYRGDPHPGALAAVPVYPAALGGDPFGMDRARALVRDLRPDVVLFQHDPWVVSEYIKRLGTLRPPCVGWMPIDGKNCRGAMLNGLTHGMFYTDFGRREAIVGGFKQSGEVLGLGVDTQVYRPMDRMAARQLAGLGVLGTKFTVGAFNRNQPRKRLDLLLSYFAQWVKTTGVDALLYLHMAPNGDRGWDLPQLAGHLGITDRVIVREHNVADGKTEPELAAAMCACDVHATTTQGEGFGLTTLEGMACGVSQVVPGWSALGEWAQTAIQVPCTEIAITPNDINMVGGVADRRAFIAALDELYQSPERRRELSESSRLLATSPRFRWEFIATRMSRALQTAMHGSRSEPRGQVAENRVWV